MNDKIKKIGKIWATESTIEGTSLQKLIVEKLESNFDKDLLLIKKRHVEYHVYGKDREAYRKLMETIKNRLLGEHKDEI